MPDSTATLPAAHNVLCSTASGALAVGSDYSATTGRTVGSFSDLVPNLRPVDTFWETAPPPAGTEDGMSAAQHLDRWAADLRTDGRPVRTVFGYCVGSVFAAGLVERIAGWQAEPPTVVLFDPEVPHAALLHRHYTDALGVMRRALTAEEYDRADAAGRQSLAEAADLRRLAVALSDLLVRTGDGAFARAGLDARRRGELLGTFRGFLLYLVAAAEIDPAPVWSGAVAISSTSPHNGLNTLPAAQRAGTVAREVRVDLPHAELLRDPAVAGAVRDLTA
jgi:hypothetical protein